MSPDPSPSPAAKRVISLLEELEANEPPGRDQLSPDQSLAGSDVLAIDPPSFPPNSISFQSEQSESSSSEVSNTVSTHSTKKPAPSTSLEMQRGKAAVSSNLEKYGSQVDTTKMLENDRHDDFDSPHSDGDPLATDLSGFQRKYGNRDGSVLHDLLRKRNWNEMKICLQLLKQEDPFVILRELTQLGDKRHATPLHISITRAPLELTTMLISLIPFEFREDILMAVDENGNAPLHIACENFDHAKSYAAIIKVLTLGAPNVHSMRNHDGECPISLLLTSGGMRTRKIGESGAGGLEKVAEELVRSILEENPSLIHDKGEDGKTLFQAAASNGVFDRVLKVLESFGGNDSLHDLASCSYGTIPSAKNAKRLVKAYPKAVSQKSSTGNTPLHLLVSNIATVITDEGSLDTANLVSLAKVLVGEGNSDESRCPLLVKNADNLTPLHCCVRYDTPIEIVSALMKNKFSHKAALIGDPYSATPLHNICASSRISEMVSLISVVGTKDSAAWKDSDGNTPLHVAVRNPNATQEVIEALGAVNRDAAKIENSKGRTPFHVAIRSKADASIVKELIKMYPKAVKVIFEGNNNIFHEMCQYETAPGVITGLLHVHPEGASMQNDLGNIPLHVAAAYNMYPSIPRLSQP